MSKSILPELAYFSFWRPDSMPNKHARILQVKLLPIGNLTEITKKILTISHMKRMLQTPKNSNRFPMMRLFWDVPGGVVLQFRTEGLLSEQRGDVISIEAISCVNDVTFHSLYVQLHEFFGVILLDETSNALVSPRDFKRAL
jgi:hypothetical protein